VPVKHLTARRALPDPYVIARIVVENLYMIAMLREQNAFTLMINKYFF